MGAASSCADYVGASEQARNDAYTVQISIPQASWEPSSASLAEVVDEAIVAVGARGGVFDHAATDDGLAVWFWVDGYVQSSGALFSAPDASVRLCVRVTVSREPTLKTAECAGKALPLPKRARVISL